MNESIKNVEQAAKNILFNCAKGQAGDTLLIVHEACDEGYYDSKLHRLVGDAAETLGFEVTLFEIAFAPDIKDPSPELAAKLAAADHSLFLARLGDQLRFQKNKIPARSIISYAIDSDMFLSSFARADYAGFAELKGLIEAAFVAAKRIQVTCPAGTDFSGSLQNGEFEHSDIHLKRFPLSIFNPVPVFAFSGCIAQNGFLTGTGSQYYQPYACELRDTLLIDFKGANITGFRGSQRDISSAQTHYEMVAKKYNIDPYFVHSWHAGIHPACRFDHSASENFERWSGAAFGNPRLLHFHSCGKIPPGEISINVVDPSIRLDDALIWEKGVLHPERLRGGDMLLARFPDLAQAFQNPAKEIGLGPAERLSFS